MRKVVLPTAAILKDFKHVEQLFSFYDGGLQGLVRDMVLTSDDSETQARLKDVVKQALCDSPLIEKVMRDYAISPEAQFLYRMGNHSQEAAVEIAAEHLYQVVLEMMSSLFMRAVYEISKQEWDWAGQDLIAQVQVLDTGEKPQ